MAHSHAHHRHDHGHGHGHHHAPASFGRAFALGILLNAGFVAVEGAYGLWAGSVALLADAGHNLGDVAGLVIAWGASGLARRRPGGRFTYGLGSSSILAALANALLLLVTVGAIAWEAVARFARPAPVAGGTVIAVAAAGIVVNGVTAWAFARGRHGDLNIRGAFLHMLGDAAVSAGVVAAGAAILLTGAAWIDPVVSLVIVGVIAASGWELLREGVALSLHAAPPGIDLPALAAFLREQAGVAAIHDLHVWPMSTTETALTVHLLLPGGYPGDGFTAGVAQALRHRFGIGHATIQVETDPATACLLEPDHVV